MRTIAIVFLFAFVYLTTSRTIQWTNAGGNPLWDFAKNWDCNCVPSLSDDVIIDVANIPGAVTIGGTAAFAGSLTVGGTSQFTQVLNVQGQLTIGAGGAKIQPNGQVYLDTAPTSPLTVSGIFQGNNNFYYKGGALAGTGSFVFKYINFTGPALKVINATTTVDTLQIVPGDGQQGSVNIGSKQLIITTNLFSTATINIYSNPGASLLIKGKFQYKGTSATSVTIRGDATIANLEIDGGIVILSDNVEIDSVTVSSGAVLTLIGGTTSIRNIKDVTGAGTLDVQGGTNNFDTLSGISSVMLEGGVLNTNGASVTAGNLLQSGGSITGTATIALGTLTLTNSQIQGPTIKATNLNVKGFAALDNTALTLTNLGVISASSQFTMANGALFLVDVNGKVSQSASFKLLPSGTDQPPLFTNNGKWTSTSDFQVVVNTRGTGGFELGKGASITLNGIAFNTDSLALTDATFTVTGSVVTIQSITGQGGVISAEGRQFVVGTITVDTFTHTNGFTEIESGTFGTLTVQTGSLNVTGSGATIAVLQFQGGQISGNNPKGGVTLTIGNATLTGDQPKTLTDLTAKFQQLNLKCGPQQCQLFTQDATIISGGTCEKKLN